MGATIAATGISGFLGSHVRTVLEGAGFEVAHLPRELRRSADEAAAWLVQRQPAALVHLAGVVDVRYCREHPLEAFESHVLDTARLLDAVRLTCPQIPVLYIATDKSFGEQEHCTVDAPYPAGFPYETSKACEDLLVESYRLTYGLPVCLLRFPNFFGEGDRHAERLIPSICLAAVEGRELVIRTRLDGTARQYLYVRDAADIVLRVLRAGASVRPHNHFGPPHVKTVGEVVHDVEEILGRRLNVVARNEPGEVSRLSLADDNFLNYEYTDWLPALRRTVDWYRAGGTAP